MIKTWKQRLQELPGYNENLVVPEKTAYLLTLAAMSEEIKELREALSGPREDDTFERFWIAYPRKIGKEGARRAWAKVKNRERVLEQVIVALEWQTKQEQWKDEKFVPHPSTYINQGRWMDERPIVLERDILDKVFARAK